MTTYHYVDQINGSDSNDGSSWATAWKTMFPLSVVYLGVTDLFDVEIRIAKTPVRETNRAITWNNQFTYYASSYGGGHSSSGVAFPTGNTVRVPLGSETEPYGSSPASFGGTILSPFVASPFAAAQQGAWKFCIQCPPQTNSRAVRWTFSAPTLTNMKCLEFTAVAHRMYKSDQAQPITATYTLFSDTNATLPIWSGTFEVPQGMVNTRIIRLPLTGLTGTARALVLSVDNPSEDYVQFNGSRPYAALLPSDPAYVGLQLFLKPNDRYGLPLTPSGFVNNNTHFNGLDGKQVDDAVTMRGLPTRTWSVYVWETYPYNARTPILSLSRAGRPGLPIRIIGGWNTETNAVEDISVIEAANLRILLNPTLVYLDVQRLGIVFRREGDIPSRRGLMSVGSGDGNYTPVSVGLNAEHIYTPCPGIGLVDIPAGFYSDAATSDSLYFNANDNVTGTARHRNCSWQIMPPWAIKCAPDTEDCTVGLWQPLSLENTSPEIKNCVFIGTRHNSNYGFGYRYIGTPVIKDCDVFATSLSDVYSNALGDFDNGPYGDYLNTNMHGPYSVPHRERRADYCTFWPRASAVSTPAIGDHLRASHLSIGRSDSAVHSTSAMFSFASSQYITGANVEITDSILDVPWREITSSGTNHNSKVFLKNVTLRHTAAATQVAFPRCDLTVDNVTMVGPWVGLQSGTLGRGTIDGLTILDPTACLARNYTISGSPDSVQYGRVSALFRNITHPLGIAGLFRDPAPAPSPGAALVSNPTESVWFTTALSVVRDTTLSLLGKSSWKVSVRMTIGIPSAGAVPLGVFRLFAGVPVKFSAYVRRNHNKLTGGLLLRPLQTDLVAPDILPIESYRDIFQAVPMTSTLLTWQKVEINFTPTSTGAVELYFAVRGVGGGDVWFDAVKVEK